MKKYSPIVAPGWMSIPVSECAVAVFNLGRIEQIGSPAEIYEHPATPVVAGFVGVSNLIRGDVAQSITGSPPTFSIRPEKIRIVDPDFNVSPEMCSADGKVRDVVYLGLYTRYLVELNRGSDLVVIQQNLDSNLDGCVDGAGEAGEAYLVMRAQSPVE